MRSCGNMNEGLNVSFLPDIQTSNCSNISILWELYYGYKAQIYTPYRNFFLRINTTMFLSNPIK